MTSGFATAAGTARYAARFGDGAYRQVQGLTVSSLGLGTYLGKADEAGDRGYVEAVREALARGINFIDTAINYRHQRSERAVGEALHGAARDEVVVCTKAGFLTPGAVPSRLVPQQIAGGMHSMDPDFLADQAERSRANLGLETIDVFYLHNPEIQLQFVARDVFDERLRQAFARLEALADGGVIRWYGTATWNGYRQAGMLDLERVLELAGPRFRFVQLPYNAAMTEASGTGVLEAARRAGVTVVASATLVQGRLLGRMRVREAIDFTRSTPGIAVALVGMGQAAHVRENLAPA